MSTFGGPGGRYTVQKPIPPERGSFPLDHDGECKSVMTQYLRCLRAHKGMNDDECRQISKAYLQCRMDRNLMAPDEMKNLGFADGGDDSSASSASKQPAAAATTSPQTAQQSKGGQ